MARNVPQNLYGNPFVSALQRLEDIALETVRDESLRKSQAERDYRATMANVMMKNAPQLNWSTFGNMVENSASFEAGSMAYEDWLSTSKKAENYSPDGSILTDSAANKLTPGIGGELVDQSILGVTRSDMNITNQWITGEGDQARSMGWGGLANEEEIDDEDLYELTDMGLIREGETWADARPKLVKRWQWWQSSYERNNESFKGDSEYAELERKEIEKRTVAMNTLMNDDQEYAMNRQILQDINGQITNSVLNTVKTREEVDGVTTTGELDMYTGIMMPAGALYYDESQDELVTVEQNMPMDLSVNALNQTILANQAQGSPGSLQFAVALDAMRSATSVVTVGDLMNLDQTNQYGIRPIQEIQKVSPAMHKSITDILKRKISNEMKENAYGVDTFRSVNELRATGSNAVIAMDAINTLNLDIGANVEDLQHPGLIQAFVNDVNNQTNNHSKMVQDYIYGTGDPSNPGLIYRAEELNDVHSKWIIDYLKSLSQNENLEEGLQNHMMSFGQ